MTGTLRRLQADNEETDQKGAPFPGNPHLSQERERRLFPGKGKWERCARPRAHPRARLSPGVAWSPRRNVDSPSTFQKTWQGREPAAALDHDWSYWSAWSLTGRLDPALSIAGLVRPASTAEETAGPSLGSTCRLVEKNLSSHICCDQCPATKSVPSNSTLRHWFVLGWFPGSTRGLTLHLSQERERPFLFLETKPALSQESAGSRGLTPAETQRARSAACPHEHSFNKAAAPVDGIAHRRRFRKHGKAESLLLLWTMTGHTMTGSESQLLL